MKDSAPSPRRLQYLRDYRRRKRSIRLWQVCLLAGLFAGWRFWKWFWRPRVVDGR